jgi:hypothetical protein
MGNARKLLALTILAVGTAALAAPSAWGITPRYAAPAASGTADCSSPANACTLRFATTDASANDGDEVIVLPGTHTLTGAELNIAKSLNVHGQAGSPMPVINFTTATTGGIRLSNDGATLSDIDLEYGGSTANASQGALMVSSGTVSRVISHTSTASVACTLSGNTTAPDSLIRDSICWSTYNTGGTGVGLNCACSSFNAELRNVDAIGNNQGILFVGSLDNQSLTIDAKNVIAHGGDYDVFAQANGTNVHSTINLNNSAYRTYFSSQSGTGSTASVTVSGTGTNIVPDIANVFVNPASDFHQKATSPTINAGATDSLTGTSDLDGNARPQASAIDIGAYETSPTTPPGSGSNNQPAKPSIKKKCKKKKHRAAAAKKKCKKHRK